MSKKWLVISTLGISLPGIILLFWHVTLPDDFHVGRKLQARGFDVYYDTLLRHPTGVSGAFTPEDFRLICQLPRLDHVCFGSDMSDLNLDGIENCRNLSEVSFIGVTNFSANEIRKLAACPIKSIWLSSCVDLKDSDLEVFRELTQLETLDLYNNPGITDACLEYLEKIPSLEWVAHNVTSITPESSEEFRKKRPDVTFHFQKIF